MQKSHHKTLFAAIILLLIGTFVLQAQPYGNMAGRGAEARKKLSAMKKIKLLEVLNLDEKTSDKFLAKYTSWEKKLEIQRVNIQKAFIDLESALSDNGNEAKIKEKTNAVLKLQKEMMKIMQDAQADIRTILTEEQFAKYVLFEHNFRRHLQQMIKKRMHGKHHNKNGKWNND